MGIAKPMSIEYIFPVYSIGASRKDKYGAFNLDPCLLSEKHIPYTHIFINVDPKSQSIVPIIGNDFERGDYVEIMSLYRAEYSGKIITMDPFDIIMKDGVIENCRNVGEVFDVLGYELVPNK